MEHIHNIIDDDKYFIIDPVTRSITNLSGGTVYLMQYDHNSERFTFEIPRYIEGHDMSISDSVEIHYTNSGSGTSISRRATNPGLYEVNDLIVDSEDDKKVMFTWLISQNATLYSGSVTFQIKFKCRNSSDPAIPDYIWGTDTFSNVTVRPGLNNTDVISNAYPDVLLQHDKRIEIIEKVSDAVEVESRFIAIEEQIADLAYEEIVISAFSNNVGTVELGTIVSDVTFTWTLNKEPAIVSLDGTSQVLSKNGNCSLAGLSIVDNKTWTLMASDERGSTSSKTSSITFLNGVYYGVAGIPTILNSEFILTLSKTLRANKLPSFSINAGNNQYIYYCVPKRFGICNFTVGGFTGGFILVDTMNFTNALGYTEEYYVYRSSNSNLGDTTVTVS